MSYTLEKGTNDIIIKGFEQGIADDPYSGIANIRNINLISVPKEASVNFSTSQISNPVMTTPVTMDSSDAGADTISFHLASDNVESRMAITFSAVTGGIGISTGVTYWLGNVNNVPTVKTAQLYTDMDLTTLVNITGNGTGTFTFYVMTGGIKYFTQDINNKTWGIDSTGRVWTNYLQTGTNGYWIFAGNTTLTNAAGNGIVAYTASDGTIYIFAFRNSAIDFLKIQASPAWTYGWNPADGSTGNATGYLKTNSGATNNPTGSHEAFLAPDNRVYYCDLNYVSRWYQTDPAVPFDPTNTATYTFDQNPLLPSNDIAQCLSFLGTNLMIGGIKNVVYPWDRFSTNFSYPILLAEFNIKKLVTVNTNTFIFVGNRGRIYLTNGSQAQLYKKIPDFLSGTVEPYFTWLGACSTKNQLYFGFSATTNGGVQIQNGNYNGVWAIDLDTKAIRLTNTLSPTQYYPSVTAIIPNFASSPAGAGLFIGWDDGNTSSHTYGIDTTISTPYASPLFAIIDTDLIPIGTVLKPTTNGRVEFKLSVPLVAGEQITLAWKQVFNDANWTQVPNGTFNTAGIYSGVCTNVDFQNSQWIQLRVYLYSTATNPSYCRLTELRLGN